MAERIAVWFPLFDTPVELAMSVEQARTLIDATRGEFHGHPEWAESIAKRIEAGLPDLAGQGIYPHPQSTDSPHETGAP